MTWLNPLRPAVFCCLLLSPLLLAGCQSGGKFDSPTARPTPATLEFTPEARLRVAAKLRAAGDYMSALRMYQDVLNVEPRNLEALAGQGELYLDMGAPQQAVSVFRAALAVVPDDARLQAGIGRALTELGEGGAAVPYFEQALAKGISDAAAHNHYGVALDLVGRHRDAQVQYGTALDKNAGDLSVMNNLALSLALSEDYPAALRLLSDLVTAAPDSWAARRNLALVYALSGDMTAADSLATAPDDAALTRATQANIRQILQVPKELRAKAIFAGLAAVADALPPAPPESDPAPAPAAQPQPQHTTPAVVDVTTRPAESSNLPGDAPPTSRPPAQPKAMDQTPAKPSETTADVPAQGSQAAYMVQLAAYPSAETAAAGWRTFQAQAPTLLEGHAPLYYPSGDVVRLGVKADGWKAAQQLCEAFKAGGLDCLARKISPTP